MTAAVPEILTGAVGGRVRWAFSTRAGGSSEPPYASLNLGGHVGDDAGQVRTNRETLARGLGLPSARVRYMDQVHGDRVAVVGSESESATLASQATLATDAMVTAEAGVAVAVLVADCVPVLLADPDAGVVAAVHAGRPGVRNGVVVHALDAMAALGAEPGRTLGWLGPSVCPACYEVPAQMRADVAGVVPQSWATSRSGTPALDLRGGLAAVLTERGVRVSLVGGCTAESAELFSYRRDGTTGRQAGLVWVEA